jgi:hypothetical protein
MCVYVSMCVYVCIFVYVCICVCVLCVYVCYVCMYVCSFPSNSSLSLVNSFSMESFTQQIRVSVNFGT